MMEGNRKTQGFTLIELLIVVAIIAILAAIAVPNFLEAQTRSKIARAKADQRNIALALEAYAMDNNGQYPPHHIPATGGASWIWVGWGFGQKKLTTPITYMSSIIPDVFQLTPQQILTQPGLLKEDLWIGGNPYVDKSYEPLAHGDKHVMDYEQFTKGGNPTDATWVARWELSYGRTMWKLQSFGPMRDIEAWGWVSTPQSPGFPSKYYDPSNGTVSHGLITRTQMYVK